MSDNVSVEYGVKYHPVSKKAYGYLKLNRVNQQPVQVEIFYPRLKDTMLVEVTPSYAVNPPFGQYCPTEKQHWIGGRTEYSDVRESYISQNIRRALQAHGEYATDQEIKMIIGAVRPLLEMIDMSPEDEKLSP